VLIHPEWISLTIVPGEIIMAHDSDEVRLYRFRLPCNTLPNLFPADPINAEFIVP
jgi:hypothetical protein